MQKLLVDVLAGWLRLAGEKKVYVEYRFSGAAPHLYKIEPEILGYLDRAVQKMLEACALLPERERWMNLELSREGDMIGLICAASGDCRLPLEAWLHPNLRVIFHREEDSARLEVRARNSKRECREPSDGQSWGSQA